MTGDGVGQGGQVDGAQLGVEADPRVPVVDLLGQVCPHQIAPQVVGNLGACDVAVDPHQCPIVNRLIRWLPAGWRVEVHGECWGCSSQGSDGIARMPSLTLDEFEEGGGYRLQVVPARSDLLQEITLPTDLPDYLAVAIIDRARTKPDDPFP
ncbi:hypothetical protein [Streptomyces sp. NPDC048106]|uniref:hypothetical protein n=1 Tax=Streptomyces sp. NPDC048106 TaxID=3155750 RepID=UPI003455C0C3